MSRLRSIVLGVVWLTAWSILVGHVGFAKEEDKKPKKPDIPKIAWYSDLGLGLTEARDKTMPVLLLLELPEQTHSRQLLAAFSEREIADLAGRFIPVRLNIRMASQLLDYLVVRIVPDLRVFSPVGRQLAHHRGHMAVPKLKAFLEGALEAKPSPGAITLSMFLPGAGLNELLRLEENGKRPQRAQFDRLVDMAGSRSGETRIEAQRLIRYWSVPLARQLVGQLKRTKLKPRVTAYDLLAEMKAPLSESVYDPWSGPLKDDALKRLEQWASTIATEKNKDEDGAEAFTDDGYPKLPAHLRAQVDADLKRMVGPDKGRAETARQRLAQVGLALVPILRRRARDVVAREPHHALRYDQLRFRLLLSVEALRKHPGVAERIAGGSPGERARNLERLLKSGSGGLDLLAQEAACDSDAFFRETAIRYLTQVMDAPDDLLRRALKDAEPNVRVAALKAMAKSAGKENAKAIAEYMATETDADLICQAVRALAKVKNRTSKKTVRSLLKDKRWQVRAAAVEALGDLRDRRAAPDLAELLEDSEGFVAAKATKVLAKVGDKSVVPLLERAVKKHPGITQVVLKALGSWELRRTRKADEIIRRFTSDKNPDVRAEAVLSLARDDERPAFEEVAAALKDKSVRVRKAAVKGLRYLIKQKTLAKYLDKGGLPEGYKEVRGTLIGFLKAKDQTLRLETVHTLCYFHDWEPTRNQLPKFILHEDKDIRAEAFEVLAFLPGKQMLELVRARARHKQIEAEDREWGRLLWRLSHLDEVKAAEWKEDEPILEAFFEVLPRLSKDYLASWCRRLTSKAIVEHYDSDKKPDTKNPRALAKLLDAKLRGVGLAKGMHRDAVRVLWMSMAELSEQDIQKYSNDKRLEIRRKAYTLMIQAENRGPKELVFKLIKDRSPEIRRLGVAAAMPGSWRQRVGDPTGFDLVGGEEYYPNRYRRYHYSSNSYRGRKLPKVIQLPLETLEELLKDDDAEVRAITAFLMALEGGDHGISILTRKWKRSGYDRDRDTLVKAVFMAWDDSLTPHLAAAYNNMVQEEDKWEIERLYKELKSLRGKRVKKLRARIRNESPAAIRY